MEAKEESFCHLNLKSMVTDDPTRTGRRLQSRLVSSLRFPYSPRKHVAGTKTTSQYERFNDRYKDLVYKVLHETVLLKDTNSGFLSKCIRRVMY